MIDREKIDLYEKEAIAKTTDFLTNAKAPEIKDFRQATAEVRDDLVFITEHAIAIYAAIPHCYSSPGHILTLRRGLQIFWHTHEARNTYSVIAYPPQEEGDAEFVCSIVDHPNDDQPFHSTKAFIDGPWRDQLHQLRLDLEQYIEEHADEYRFGNQYGEGGVQLINPSSR